MATEIPNSSNQDSKTLNASDILSALSETDTTSDEGTKEETKVTEKSDDEDTSARSDESEDDKETHEEVIEIPDFTEDQLIYEPSVNVANLKKEFPELAKKFPTLEKTIRREAHYAEVFPTIQEARDAAEKVQSYQTIENDLNNGTISGVLSDLQKNNKESFTKIADDILTTIRSIDEQSFLRISGNNLKQALNGVYNRGKSLKSDDGEQLALAAQILHNEIFRSSDMSVRDNNGNNGNSELTEERKKLETERAQFEQTTFNNHVNDVNSRVESNINDAVTKAIDPKDVMTPYVESKAVSDCMDQLIKSIQDDVRFNKQLTAGWMTVREQKYSDSSKAKIRQMLISKARAELPAIVQRVKNEALKGSTARTREASETKDEKPLPRGRASGDKSSSNNGKKEIPRNMSTRDYLMQD